MCAALESLDIGSLWSTDGEGRLTYLSPNAHTVLTRGDGAKGQTFLDLFVAPRAGIDGQRTLPFVFARRSRFESVIARSEKDGRDIIWSLSGDARSDAAGNFTGF